MSFRFLFERRTPRFGKLGEIKREASVLLMKVMKLHLTIACPGRNFAIAELCMLAARMVQTFDFSEPSITERLRFDDQDFDVGLPVQTPNDQAQGTAEIIDLDNQIKTILHPGNASDSGELKCLCE